MSSPANADSEATPDPPARSVRPKDSGAIVQSKEKKALTGGLFDKPIKSGRGAIVRKPFPDGALRRVSKRRKRDADRDVQLAPRRSSNDSDSEEELPSSSESYQHPPIQPMGFIPSILTFIDAHPSLPNTLSFYVQFLLNCFFAFCMMYVLYGFYSTICHDIEDRAMMESSEILAEMAACAHGFNENRCDRASRIPAMEMVCNNWEKCMQRDPLKVGRSRLSAGMFAEIFNGFIEPISLKAIVGCPRILSFQNKETNKTHKDRQPNSHNRLFRSQQPHLWPLEGENSSTARTSSTYTLRTTAASAADGLADAEPAVLHALSESCWDAWRGSWCEWLSAGRAIAYETAGLSVTWWIFWLYVV